MTKQKRYTFNFWDSEKGRFAIKSSATDHVDAVEQAANWARITREQTGADVWPVNVKRGWNEAAR